jgi:hypothetical protein
MSPFYKCWNWGPGEFSDYGRTFVSPGAEQGYEAKQLGLDVWPSFTLSPHRPISPLKYLDCMISIQECNSKLARRCTPEILATKEAEADGSWVQGQPWGKKVARSCLKNKIEKRREGSWGDDSSSRTLAWCSGGLAFNPRYWEEKMA